MMTFRILIAMLCLTGFVQIFIPYMLKRTVVFGVTIPASHINHDTVKRAKKAYSISLTIIWFVLIIGYFTWILRLIRTMTLQ